MLYSHSNVVTMNAMAWRGHTHASHPQPFLCALGRFLHFAPLFTHAHRLAGIVMRWRVLRLSPWAAALHHAHFMYLQSAGGFQRARPKKLFNCQKGLNTRAFGRVVRDNTVAYIACNQAIHFLSLLQGSGSNVAI